MAFKFVTVVAALVVSGLPLVPLLSEAQVAATPTAKLTFAETLERALEKSLEFRSLKLNEQNAVMTESSAWWALAPSFDLSASHTFLQSSLDSTRNTTAGGYPWSTQLGLSVTENLYDNGDTWRLAKAASLKRKSEALNLEKGRARLLVDVAKAYYDFSQAAVALDLRQQQTESIKVQHKSIQSRYRQGVQSNRDYLRIQAQMENSEISLLNQQIQLNSAKTALKVAIGEFEEADFIAVDPSKQSYSGIAPEGEIDPRNSYEFRIADILNEVAELEYTTVARTELPRLSLKGNFDYIIPQYLGTGPDNRSGDPFWNLQAMVVLDYRLWDWGNRQRTVNIAENKKQIEYNNQDKTKLKTLGTLAEMQFQAKLLRASFAANQRMLKANRDAFQSMNTGYLEGKVTYLELITALNDLYESRSKDLTLRINILKLRAEIAYYQGNVDEVLKAN